MERPEDLVTVGRIATAHGIRGELAVEPFTDFPERLDPGSVLLLVMPDGVVSERRILGRRPHKGRFLVWLEGVTDRTTAESLRGARLCVREVDLPDLPPGTVWRHELPGMEVVAEDGGTIGRVRELIDIGKGNLVLALDGPKGEILLPFVEPVIREIDAAARRIVAAPPSGLIP